MKGFERENPWFSLCGLNCGLCTMHLGGYCGGCGFGNQPCKITRCSLEHGRIEYCFLCEAYPCEKYDHIDDFDSFITHKNRKSDMQKAERIGMEAYNREQREKAELLHVLLSNYNDGRRKTLFALAANLLEADELKEVVRAMENSVKELTLKEKAAQAAALLRGYADRKGIELKLRKK